MPDPRKVPVIVGTGEVIDRDNAYEPRSLITRAVHRANEDAHGLARQADSFEVVGIVSWTYQDIGRVVAAELGAPVRQAAESAMGGEKPIRLLGEIAERIASGVSEVAVLCGGEAMRTRAKAGQAGTPLAWGPTRAEARPRTALDHVTAHAARYGLVMPASVYPLYENRTRYSWEQSAAEAEYESALLWSRNSAAAAANPYAWITRPYGIDEIASDHDDNRMIAYPYRKLMVANPSVNQAAAIVVTSLAKAREAGIPEDRLVYVWSGAYANEPEDFLQRDRYDRSTAQDAVLEATLAMAGARADEIDLLELYSCFPTVPKMARRALGLGEDVHPSIAGGLSFFGGPANNYMSHAVAAAVRLIRAGRGRNAMLYGQGEYVTKHAAVILCGTAPEAPPVMRAVQAQADAAANAAPALLEIYSGPAAIETFTVDYDRAGAPAKAVVVARTPAGERVVALLGPGDTAGVATLIAPERSPIGLEGAISSAADGRLLFHFA